MKKLRYILEYLGLRFMLWILDCLSLSAATRFAESMADIWYCLSVGRARTARANIKNALIARSDKDISRIARDSFRHFGVLVVESLKSCNTFTEENWRDKMDIEASDEVMEVLKKPEQGIIMVSGHLGNWEIASQLISYIKPVVGITRKMNNPHSEKLISDRKPRNRFRLTPKHDHESGRFISALKDGEILALLVDQYARDQGVMVTFFGQEASTYTSPAMLHLVTRMPLFFASCIRKGPMSYKLKIVAIEKDKSTGKRAEDVKAILEKINRELEAAIRENPEQYLWAHRRWRRPKKHA